MNRKVLIADDDPNMIRILSHILEREGFTVISENNGLSALESARKEKPDLIILDLMMPFLDGFGVLMRLYGDEPPCITPSILLTAQDSVEFKDVAEALGAVKFLEKPFEVNALVKCVREAIGD